MKHPAQPSMTYADLMVWYTRHGRHTLPWRQIYDLPLRDRLYRIWIAEVMLQQTQVDRVVSYYNRFLETYPTIDQLAATDYETLYPLWQGLGYYSRARRMIDGARRVVADHGGIFPRDGSALLALPGIGEYTACAIRAFGYDEPVLALDANIRKIIARYFLGSRYAVYDLTDEHIEDFRIVFGEVFSGRDINNALMDLASWTDRTSDVFDHYDYPLRGDRWYETRGVLEVRAPSARKKHTKPKHAVVFLHENHRQYFSSCIGTYEPFLIEILDRDARHAIQDYFSTTYGLEVSVRPSFARAILADDAVALFYAQVQSGSPAFTTYAGDDAHRWRNAHLIATG